MTQKGLVYFTIVGVVSHSFPAGDGGESLVMADDLARTYFGATADGFDDLVVTTKGPEAAIAATAASYGMQAVQVSVIESDARDALQHSIGLVLAVAVISVLIAMLAVVNTLLVNVRQGTRELALLRAVGLGSRQAMRRVLTEAGLLAAAATLIGVAAGCLIAVPMLQASTTPTFAPGFVFPIETVVVLILIVVLAAVVATIGPARTGGANVSAQRAASRVAVRRTGGWGACGTVVIVAAMALAACGDAASSLATGDPLHDLITLDQLVVPDFTVSSPAAHVDASTLAGGDSALAAALTADGLQSAASVEYQRGVDFSTSNGPIDVVATVMRFASIAGAIECVQRERQAARRDVGCGPDIHRTARRRGAFDQRRAHHVGRPPGGGDHRGVARRQPRQHHHRARTLRRNASRRCAACSPACRRRTSPKSSAEGRLSSCAAPSESAGHARITAPAPHAAMISRSVPLKPVDD